MFLLCTNSSPWQIHAAKNLICCSVNLCFLQIWYRKSPPGIKSIIKYNVSLSWNAWRMFTKNLCFKYVSSFLSFRTDSILFFVIILSIKIIRTLLLTFISLRTKYPFSSTALCKPAQIHPFQSRECTRTCSCLACAISILWIALRSSLTAKSSCRPSTNQLSYCKLEKSVPTCFVVGRAHAAWSSPALQFLTQQSLFVLLPRVIDLDFEWTDLVVVKSKQVELFLFDGLAFLCTFGLLFIFSSWFWWLHVFIKIKLLLCKNINQ